MSEQCVDDPRLSKTKKSKLSAPASKERFTISELAKEFRITPRTIRFYEDKGLLSPERVAGVRTYSRRDRARLVIILRAKRVGFSLEDIAEYLDLYDTDPTQVTQHRHLLTKIEALMSEYEQRRANIDQTLRELKSMRASVIQCLKQDRGARRGT